VGVSLAWLSDKYRDLTSSLLDLRLHRRGYNGLLNLGLLRLNFSRGSFGDGSSHRGGGVDSLDRLLGVCLSGLNRNSWNLLALCLDRRLLSRLCILTAPEYCANCSPDGVHIPVSAGAAAGGAVSVGLSPVAAVAATAAGAAAAPAVGLGSLGFLLPPLRRLLNLDFKLESALGAVGGVSERV
jgi:hypothetical protein